MVHIHKYVEQQKLITVPTVLHLKSEHNVIIRYTILFEYLGVISVFHLFCSHLLH